MEKVQTLNLDSPPEEAYYRIKVLNSVQNISLVSSFEGRAGGLIIGGLG